MKVTYDRGNLSLPIFEVIEHLSIEDKLKLVEHLACDEAIIKHVSDQILDGFTESCCNGSTCGTSVEPHTALDKARRRVSEMANDVCKRELEGALRSMRQQQAWCDHYSGWAFDMYHAWGKTPSCPQRDYPKRDDGAMYEVIKKGVVA